MIRCREERAYATAEKVSRDRGLVNGTRKVEVGGAPHADEATDLDRPKAVRGGS